MGKRLEQVRKLVEANKQYSVVEAVRLVKQCAKAKFDETIELHVRLGIDPKQSDQNVRGVVNLPHGTGKSRRVAVIASGEKIREAESAGADAVGAEELIEKIAGGWTEFDVLVATPDMMKNLSKLGKILGPRGLMPNPKAGTVTFELAKTLKDIKAGRVEFKCDGYGIVHCAVGKASFPEEKLAENIEQLMAYILRLKPPTSKGIYIKKVSLSSTMGPGIEINPVFKAS